MKRLRFGSYHPAGNEKNLGYWGIECKGIDLEPIAIRSPLLRCLCCLERRRRLCLFGEFCLPGVTLTVV